MNGSGLHVETVYCLGNCALSPAALLDGAPIGRLDRDRIDAIVAAAQEKTQ
jgi:formate dehydrogenase subunit gamma